jgi:hypothetical protein
VAGWLVNPRKGPTKVSDEGKVDREIMRKIQLLGIALVVVCAFSAFTVASASALTLVAAKWLANGAVVNANLAADTLGELLFENVLNGGAILCSGLFEGTVGANGVDNITKVFNLAGTEIPALDETGATGGLSCSGEKTCETGSEIWPVGLPFKTQLDLDTEDGKFYDLVLNAEYFILCLFFGSSINELCVAAAGTMGEVKNVAGGVEAVGSTEPLGTCNGNTEDGLITAEPNLLTVTGETLSVSE